ncbi:hypothetical protein LF41_2327 [Lysobacter dokdonensis DS-58]|uniref:Transmembrane protein n=1 Tax=Lysobacter dokdonensis DS-58 TaxID=1300345 RepID=A0A0A2X3K5_9GAMM|nr:hypothetical protein [Lysobacter dokdonensis]KGQ19824.1 hypothetical protein LF41_2327 [Lysobacter dokdonensis DS-58]
MESITAGEFALLLVLSWGPVYLVAAFVQWRLLGARKDRAVWLVGALLFECLLALAIWLSPLNRHFVTRPLPGVLDAGSFPLQAALLASVVTTLAVWLMGRSFRQAR